MRRSILWWIHHYRGVLISPPMIFAIFCFSYETESDWLIWPIGGSLLLLGFAIRVWAQQHIRRRLKGPRYLVTTGPYSFVRNPLYIGNTLILLGATVVSELMWFAPVTLLWCGMVYSIVVRYEEAHLSDRYGQPYRSYMLKVPRWFPLNLRLKNIGLINEYLRVSIVAEAHCLLMLLPYLFKEIMEPWFGH